MRERVFGLRLSEEEGDMLDVLVQDMTALAEEHGIAARVTPSSVFRDLLRRAYEARGSEPTKTTRIASNVAAARAKLREGRSSR